MFTNTKNTGDKPRQAGHHLGIGGILAIECIVGGYIATTNHGTLLVFGYNIPLAWPEAIVSIVLGMLATAAFMQAQTAKLDPRKEVQAQAGIMRNVGFACLIVPIVLLAQAYSRPVLMQAHTDYVSGSVYPADKAIAKKAEEGSYTNPMQVAEATARLAELEAAPLPNELDFWSVIKAILVYLLITLTPGMIAMPAKETAEEAAVRLEHERQLAADARKEEIAEKGRRTKAINAAMREAINAIEKAGDATAKRNAKKALEVVNKAAAEAAKQDGTGSVIDLQARVKQMVRGV